MLHKLRTNRGFTLVEIMIVVAIIALLAAIAVPGFLRARKRSQATSILNDARIIDGAIDQYALENVRQGSASVTAAMLKPYFKPATRLYVQAGSGATTLTDIMGGNYSFTTFDGGVKVDTASEADFVDVIDNASSFWGSYYQ